MLIGVIGLGEIAGKAYLPVLGSMEGIELALCSRSPLTVQSVQETYRISRATTDLAELTGMGIQAAFVLSPSETHYAITKELLEKGVDVFLEKPATLHSQETQALAELADRRGRILIVGLTGGMRPCTCVPGRPGRIAPSAWRYSKNTAPMPPTRTWSTSSPTIQFT